MNKRQHKQARQKAHQHTAPRQAIEGKSWRDEQPHTELAQTVLPLEPRFMFDAAGLATGAEVTIDATAQAQIDTALDATAPAVTQNDNNDLIEALAAVVPPSNSQEIIFVDSSIDDYQTLLSGINPNVEVIMLDANRDGVEQIAEVLSNRSDISAIHIISHGDVGQLNLGNTTLTADSMQSEHADELAIIGQALSSDADILIYGCNFAEGKFGQQAAETLAELTDADVAASNDLTGATELGGDWDMEVQEGDIETDVAISAEVQGKWINTLDVPLTSGPVAASYTVTGSGQATITITGADGGLGSNTSGGQGATVTAIFNVSAGDVIDYVVGGVGSAGTSAAGGGGSTGVYINGELVLVAGGGGGGDNSASPGADGLGGNDADLVNGSDGDAGTGTSNTGTAGTGGNGGGGTSPAGGGGGGGGVLSVGGNSDGNGGAASSAGLMVTGAETVSLVNGGTGEGALGGAGGAGFTGGGGGGEFYAAAGGGYSGGGAAGNNGGAGGGGSFVNTTFTDTTASFVSGSSTPGGDGTSALANGSIQITLVTPVDAVDDTNTTDEDTPIAGNVLTNDINNLAATLTPGITEGYLAQLDTDGDAIWEDEVSTHDWTFGANINATTTASNFPLFTESFVLPVAGSGATATDYNGVATNASDSFEFWFKFDASMVGSGNSFLLFETGDTFGGIALTYNDTTGDIEFHYDDDAGGLSVFSITANLTGNGIDPTDEFFQVVFAMDDANDQVDLYLNGAIAATGVGAGVTIDDYADSDDAGLGTINGDATDAPDSVVAAAAGALDYVGEISAMLFYNDITLSASQVSNNYSSFADHFFVSTVDSSTSSGTNISELNPGGTFTVGVHNATITTDLGGLVTMSYDGSYTYDPNGAFESLGLGESVVDTFTYTAQDINGNTDTATVSITVNGIEDSLTATDDTYGSGMVNEDAGLTVLSTGLLGNDFDDRSIVAGATLDWNPTVDMDVLDDDGGVAGPDWLDSTGSALWELDANVTLNTSPTTNHTGITASYVFDGSGSSGGVFDFGATGSQDSFQNITGNPTDASATLEIWFKDAGTASGEQIIFETGAAGDGTSLKFNDSTNVLTLSIKDSATTLTNTFDLDSIGLDASADFVQVVWTYNRNNPGTTDTVTLYVNGAQAGAAQTSTSLNDWAGGDDSGLGRIDGNINVPGGSPFAGEIAIFRFYESALSLSEVQQNYSTVAGPQITLIDSTMSGATVVTPGTPATITTDMGGEVTVSADGSISYNPNAITPGLFSSLNFGETATDSFTYTISDGTVSDTATVTITINANNEFELSSLSTGGGTDGTIFNGIAAGDRAGFVLASGDINGDGFDDLVIGGPGVDSFTGETYVVFGQSGGFAAQFDLSTLAAGTGTTGFVINGVDNFDISARSIDVGDINGDGFADLIIGANRADPNSTSAAGETYVVFGHAGPFSAEFNLSTLASGDGSTGFVLNGIDANDISGQTVAFVGDVDGDGLGDIAITAPWADPNGSYSGETYLVYGRTDFAPILTAGEFELSSLASDATGANGTVFNGGMAADYSGSSVVGAGDVNGDGFDDLVIGAWGATPGARTDAGISYVVFGQAGGLGVGVFDLSTDITGTNGFALNGVDANDYSGIAVSSAGDINGDGFADIVVSAIYADPNGTSSGETYVVFGRADFSGILTGGEFELSTLAAGGGTNGVVFNGVAADHLSGHGAETAGDINGDGFDDLLIGRWNYTDVGDTGENYVVFGASSFTGTVELSSFIPVSAGGTAITTVASGFILSGIDTDDDSGTSVSSAGDVNGDGFDDLIIGAYHGDPGGNASAGEAYIIYGKDFRHESPVVGSSGADVVSGDAGDNALSGGAGDDTIIFDASDTRRVDGGGGTDILSVTGSAVILDLTSISNTVYQGIEVIDLTGSGNNTLILTALDLFDLSGSSNILTVTGNAGDTVIATGGWISNGVVNILGIDYNEYQSGEAILRIQDVITDTVSAVLPTEGETLAEEQELIAEIEQEAPLEKSQDGLAIVENLVAKTKIHSEVSQTGVAPFSQQLKNVANIFTSEANALMAALTS